MSEKKEHRTVKLEKLVHTMDIDHPNGIDEGHTIIGVPIGEPTVGESFQVIHFELFRTSTVEEIIDKNTFRTLNSIYRWKYIETEKL